MNATDTLDFVTRGRRERYGTGERTYWRTRCGRYRVAHYRSDYVKWCFRAEIWDGERWLFVTHTLHRTKAAAIRACQKHHRQHGGR